MAITYNIALEFYSEDSNKPKGSITVDRDDVSCDEYMGPQYYEIANGASDLAIGLGPLTTAACLTMIPSAAMTFKLNGGSTVFTFVAGDPVAFPNVTALTVSNATGATAYLEIAAAGT